jgi:hypothetical protein
MAITYEILATTAPTAGTTDTVTFSSISQSYTDLRFVANFTKSTDSQVNTRFNNNSTVNYGFEDLFASTASGIVATRDLVSSLPYAYYSSIGATTNPILITLDVMSYANSLNKSFLYDVGTQSLGSDANETRKTIGCGSFAGGSGAPITSLSIYLGSGTFGANSTFTLFGIKRA